MKNKTIYTEENIEKLLNSSIGRKYQLDNQLKDKTYQLLEQKVIPDSKESQAENKIVIGLTVIWIAFLFIVFTQLRISIYMLDFIKLALGLSLVFIPVSGIVLLILKWRKYEKKVV